VTDEEDAPHGLAPLAAAGALDAKERARFDEHARRCKSCRDELRAAEAAVARLADTLAPVPPRPELRGRILAAADRRLRGRVRRTRFVSWLATAAALALAVAFLVARVQRDSTRAELREARQKLTDMDTLRDLLARPDSRTAALAGLAAAPRARARVVWDPASRQAVLLASGLDPAPSGKAYEVWVIAAAAPVPAGTFQPDAAGRAVFRLPALEDTTRVRTFAVTVEPAAGSAAPTGPMVLAGAAS
jgi:anti-sigma-K factor RskA